MRVIRASAMGMCFGVRDALAVVRSEAQPASVTILGELVHNDAVLRELDERGFRRVAEGQRGDLPATPAVLVTAHGSSSRELSRLQAAGKNVIDTTCPLVRHVHRVAAELRDQGYRIVILGKPGHVEIQGILGDLDSAAVVQRVEDVRHYGVSRLGVICQTTLRPDLAETLIEEIRRRNPGTAIRAVDTICQPTRDRQAAAGQLLDEVDAVVVVGGKNSNNTRQLIDLARRRGVPALHVQSSADLVPSWFSPFETVGLTAGTSTLPSTIDDVHRALLALHDTSGAVPVRVGASARASDGPATS